MTRLVRLSGGIVLAAIVLAAIYGGYVVHKIKRNNEQAASFVKQVVSAMVSNWNPDELVKHSAPEWLSPSDKAGLPALFQRFSALGKLKTLHEPAGRVGKGAFPGTMINGVWAEYAVVGEFEGGSAEFQMLLKAVEDGWHIVGFQVVSEALTKKP